MKNTAFLFLSLLCFVCGFDVYSADTNIPTVYEILEGIQTNESSFFKNDSFLVRCQRTKCEEITKSRYSGGYLNTEFIVAKKDSKWLTSKQFIHKGVQNKEGRNIVNGLWVPLEPETYIVKGQGVFGWLQYGTSASIDMFSNGSGNMHQCCDYFRHIGWDLSRHLVEDKQENYDLLMQKEWLKDYLDHPFLPDFLEKNRSNYKISPQQEDVDGFPCWVVEYPGMDKFWIDTEHGYVVRKRVYHWEPGKPKKFAIHNSDFREVKPGIWLPYKQIVDKYASIKSEEPKIWDKIASRLYYQLEEVLINDVSDGIFDIKPPAGTRIVDNIRGIIYTIHDETKDPFEDPIKQGIAVLKARDRMAMWRFIGVVVINICIILFIWLHLRAKARQNRENNKKDDDKTEE
ncbi:hypothetical protein FACS1894189_5700 [Planctomycetales bacterium]|nr:hypothetical protein FACS1894189_5700 [Planctomycetales bacterium]